MPKPIELIAASFRMGPLGWNPFMCVTRPILLEGRILLIYTQIC